MGYSMPNLIQSEEELDPQEKKAIFKFHNHNLFEIIANFRMKTQFFPKQRLAKIIFFLKFGYNGDTSYHVWFDLDLNRSKRSIFRIRYSRKLQVYAWNSNFFPGQAIAFFLF